MIGKFSDIINLFNEITSLDKLDEEYCIVFVYNSPKTMNDMFHTTECIFPEELHMITSSFRKVAKYVYSIDGEDAFIDNITSLRSHHKYIIVYSMAQNLTGNGRRSLIPLLCEYYKLINMGADFISCTLGRSKDIMYELLYKKGIPFPKTFWFKNSHSFRNIPPEIQNGKWILKPNNESSSIGMEVHNFSNISLNDIKKLLQEYQQNYPVFCVQEFIAGDEVAVPILKIQNHYYCPGISQVDFPKGFNYINYDMIALETYGYFEYQGPVKEKLIQISTAVSNRLNLTAMSRIDFRIRDNIPYVEDIGANPTISEANGVNQLYCNHLSAEPWCVYAILVYAALINYGLFKPTFHHSPDNR